MWNDALFFQMGVSNNRGTPKSSILIGFSIINHPFWGTPIFGNTQIPPENVFDRYVLGGPPSYLLTFGAWKPPGAVVSVLQLLGGSRFSPVFNMELGDAAWGDEGKTHPGLKR